MSGTTESIYVRRLRLADAPAMAALEREVCPVDLQAGTAELRVDLENAEFEASNLSFGLFDDGNLVGVIVAYFEPDVRRLLSYFDTPCPPDIAAEECVFVADFSVKREYARYTQRLVRCAWHSVKPEYRTLPLYGFSTSTVVKRWRRVERAFGRLGYEYAGDRRFELAGPPHEIHLVKLVARAQPLRAAEPALSVHEVRTLTGWNALEPHWDELLRETPDSTGFQSFRVQQIWARHLLRDSRLFVLAVYAGSTLRALAPFRIETTEYLGQPRRLLKFIGEPSEMDRPTILRRGEDREAVRAVLEHVLARRELWDAVLFYEQPNDGTLLEAAMAAFDAPDWLVGVVEGPPCPWVDVRGSWADFVASKPRGFKKQLAQKRRRLEKLGRVEVVTYDAWPAVSAGFDTYLDVERRSWKPAKRLGVAKDRATLDYHASLVAELGPLGKVHVRALVVAGKPIAASFGLVEHGRFLSLHIVHDSAYNAYSPGMLLTASELEECYARPEITDYEFLGGFLNNKLTWTPRARETRQFYAYRRTPLFRAHYTWHFRIEPKLKGLLRRTGLLEGVRRVLKGNGAAETASD